MQWTIPSLLYQTSGKNPLVYKGLRLTTHSHAISTIKWLSSGLVAHSTNNFCSFSSFLFFYYFLLLVLAIFNQKEHSWHTVSGHDWPASETSFELRFPGGPIVARFHVPSGEFTELTSFFSITNSFQELNAILFFTSSENKVYIVSKVKHHLIWFLYVQ